MAGMQASQVREKVALQIDVSSVISKETMRQTDKFLGNRRTVIAFSHLDVKHACMHAAMSGDTFAAVQSEEHMLTCCTESTDALTCFLLIAAGISVSLSLSLSLMVCLFVCFICALCALQCREQHGD